MIDPIDGTQNYILGRRSVLCDGWSDRRLPAQLRLGLCTIGWQPLLWWPRLRRLSPEPRAEENKEFPAMAPMDASADVRLLMGSRDRKAHPWVSDLDHVSLVKTGSIGLKVGRILDGQADVFVHLSRKLKIWDTAGPAAIALGAGLEVGSLDGARLTFPLPAIIHDSTVVMGRPGALSWCHNHLYKSYQSLSGQHCARAGDRLEGQ